MSRLLAGVAALLLLTVPAGEVRAESSIYAANHLTSSAASVTTVTARPFREYAPDPSPTPSRICSYNVVTCSYEVVGFAEPVVITVGFDNRFRAEGSSKIRLTVGTQERYAYRDRSDGPRGSSLRFVYWVQAADYDMDGIDIVAEAGIILNGGTITTRVGSLSQPRDGEAANLALDGATIDVATHSGDPLKVNGGLRSNKVPHVTYIDTISRPQGWYEHQTFRRGEEMEFAVSFSPAVTVTGMPRLHLHLGAGEQLASRYADYDAARSEPDRLIFSYTVQAEDYDSDGVAVAVPVISLNGGTIVIHGGTTRADLTFFGQDEDTSLTTHGLGCKSSTSVCKVYGGSGEIPFLENPYVHQVVFVSSPRGGSTYRRGEEIRVAVQFRIRSTWPSMRVTGTPQLGLTIGAQTRQASYVDRESEEKYERYYEELSLFSESGLVSGTYLVFTYTVQATDLDADGISIAANALALNGGTITLSGDSTRAASLIHTAVAPDATRKVDGRPNPGGGSNPEPSLRVSTVRWTGTPASGVTYRLGEQIRAAVTFSEAVTVTGTPQLGLTIGTQTRPAVYDASQSEGTLGVFTYYVQATDADADGISIAANALTLNGGTITRASDSATAAALTHAGVGTDDTRKVDGSTDVVEHGNSREQATLLVLSTRTTGEVGETGNDDDFRVNVAAERSAEVAGALEQAGDGDYFRVEVAEAGRLTAETTGTTDTVGVLQGATGQTLTEDDDGGTASNFRVERQVQAGTYYVAVMGGDSEPSVGLYTLAVRFTPVGSGTTGESVVPAPRDSPPAAGGAAGAGAEQSRPATLRVNTETTGRLEQAGEVDYFRVEVQAAGTVRVEASGAAAPAAYFGAGNGPLLPQGAGGRAAQAAWPVTAGTYHVAVVGGATRTQTGAYSLAVRFTAASEAGPLRATLLNVAPAQAWMHFYCGRTQAAEAAACMAEVQCGPQDGVPVAWDVEVAPETIVSYWPGRTTADGASANFEAALVTAGRPEAEAGQRTTCRVFSPDPLEVRAYTRIGQDVVPVAQSPAPLDTTAPMRVATLLNVAPAQALVHLSCRKAPAAEGEPVDPCNVRLQCGQQEGTPVAWEVAVAAETTLTYGPGGTTDDLATALVAAGKSEAEAQRRTTCQVFSRDPLDAWAYTRVGGDLVSVTNPPAAVDAGAPTRVATLLNVAPAQAWVHFYCRKAHDPAADTMDPCTVRLQCGQQAGAPVAWDVEVAPETIVTYWPGRTTADGTPADFAAALVAAGKTAAEAQRRTTCQVFSTDPVDVRGYTQVGGAVVPIANPPIMPAADAPPTRIGTLLNLSPAQAWVHFYCRKAHQPEAETAAPCNVHLQCGQQDGTSVGWDIEVAPETIMSYWPGRTATDGTSDNLAAALVAAGKTEAEARRRTTCQVFSADPVDVRGYTQLGETVVPVKN